MRCPVRSRSGSPFRFEPRAAPAAIAPVRRYAASAPSPPRAAPAWPQATLHVFRSCDRSISLSPSCLTAASVLNEFLQAVERFIPPLRDVLEIAPRRDRLFRLELPDALSAAPDTRDEPSCGEHVQVLGNGLASDRRPDRQPRYRQRAIGTKSGYQREPGFVTERRKYRRSAGNLARAAAIPRHIARCSRAAQSSQRRSPGRLQHVLAAGCDRSLTRSR